MINKGSTFWAKDIQSRMSNCFANTARVFTLSGKTLHSPPPHCYSSPLILKIGWTLSNTQWLLSPELWLITLWRVWNPRGSKAREILQKGHFYFLLSLTHSFSTKLCTLVSRAWTNGAFVFLLHTVLCVPKFMHVKSCCKQKCTPWITKETFDFM